MGKFQAGNKASKGRQKGSQNKFTADMKQVFLNVFDRLGGEDWLWEFANNDPKTFVMILAKLLPNNLNLGDANGEPITITIRGYDGNKSADTSA